MLEEDSIWKDITIYNRQNESWKEVGSYIKELTFTESLIFIGGTTKIPDNSKF